MFWYLGKQVFEILVDIEIIGFCCLYYAIKDRACFGSVNGVYELPVFFPTQNGLIACSAGLLSSGIFGSERNSLKYFS